MPAINGFRTADLEELNSKYLALEKNSQLGLVRSASSSAKVQRHFQTIVWSFLSGSWRSFSRSAYMSRTKAKLSELAMEVCYLQATDPVWQFKLRATDLVLFRCLQEPEIFGLNPSYKRKGSCTPLISHTRHGYCSHASNINTWHWQSWRVEGCSQCCLSRSAQKRSASSWVT